MEESYFAFKNETTGKFIAIDRGSGGYPYDTTLKDAHKFFTKEKAFEYRRIISPKENWVLHLVTLTIKSEKV